MNLHVEFCAEHLAANITLESLDAQVRGSLVILERGGSLKALLAVLTLEFRGFLAARVDEHVLAKLVLVGEHLRAFSALDLFLLVLLVDVCVHIGVVVEHLAAVLTRVFHLLAVRPDDALTFVAVAWPTEMELHVPLQLRTIRERSLAQLALDFLVLVRQ